jgi:hypothetical protein
LLSGVVSEMIGDLFGEKACFSPRIKAMLVQSS